MVPWPTLIPVIETTLQLVYKFVAKNTPQPEKFDDRKVTDMVIHHIMVATIKVITNCTLRLILCES